jgi:hypothetical protein
VDRTAVFRFDFAAAGFDALDETLGDALVCPVFEFLLAFFADGGPAFEAARLAGAFDPGLVLRAGGLPVFSRVFLDIRLPFVAFRGSIIEVLRQAGFGRFGLFGLCSKGIRHATRPLAWLQPSNKRGARRSASTLGVPTLLRMRESTDYLQI